MNVGYYCTYIPEEIIQACGASPRFLIPSLFSENHISSYLPTPFCPFAKSLLANLLSGVFNDIDFIIFGAGCDAGKKLYDLFRFLHSDFPCTFLEIPHTTTENARRFYAHSLHHLAQNLLSLQELPLSDFEANLQHDIESNFSSKQHFTESFMTGRLPGYLYHSHSFLSPETIPQKEKTDHVPILLIASHLFVQDLILKLEEKKFLVFDGSALGMRWKVFPDIYFSHQSDALTNLSQWYLFNKVPCPGYSPQKRLAILQKTISNLNIRGIIYFYPKFCDHSLYDVAFLKKHLGTPFLSIEHDTSFSSFSQWETRIDAFREVLLKC